VLEAANPSGSASFRHGLRSVDVWVSSTALRHIALSGRRRVVVEYNRAYNATHACNVGASMDEESMECVSIVPVC
jgi:hypothetical protein